MEEYEFQIKRVYHISNTANGKNIHIKAHHLNIRAKKKLLKALETFLKCIKAEIGNIQSSTIQLE